MPSKAGPPWLEGWQRAGELFVCRACFDLEDVGGPRRNPDQECRRCAARRKN